MNNGKEHKLLGLNRQITERVEAGRSQHGKLHGIQASLPKTGLRGFPRVLRTKRQDP